MEINEKELKRIEVVTSNRTDLFVDAAAQAVSKALERASSSGASWTAPTEIYPNEIVEINFNRVEKITRFYERTSETESAYEELESEGGDEWDF